MKELINKIGKSQLFKVVALLFGLLVCAYCTTLLAFELIPNQKLTILDKSNIASTLKNIIQSLFFTVTLILAILSYLQAKETLFNPIRTEIFKFQISEFEKILLFFKNKTETDFTKAFDFDKILRVNAVLMLDDFVLAFYKNETTIDVEHRKEMMHDFHGSVVSLEFIMENFQKPEYHQKHPKPEKIEITNPALILKKWQNYKYGKIEFTKQFNEQSVLIKEFLASPLLPEELKGLIVKFDNAVHNNLMLVGSVLTEISQELPDKFPNKELLSNVDLSGIWNRYNNKTENLEEHSKSILQYINKYLKIEKLIEQGT